MHIVEVEIDNFKSFARKTAIPFTEGYTVVTGPNGSGKSNIIDAILFVLSLSSLRNLRAENMSDFINTNSGKNTAEVSLEFSDGTRIRRKIEQTASSTYSYCYLNDRTSSQAEILDFLAKNGIRPHGYHVVMQGDLDRIMSMKGTELRGIIDGIAGVVEFDAKKAQFIEELRLARTTIDTEAILARVGKFERMKRDAFMATYYAIAANFQLIYRQLTGGAAWLVLDDGKNPFNGGLDFAVSSEGNEVHRLNTMSGGEKSLTTLSFIFAIQQYLPAPFYLLDEVDSVLDDVSAERLSQTLRTISGASQFIIVSHRDSMISNADRILDITFRNTGGNIFSSVFESRNRKDV